MQRQIYSVVRDCRSGKLYVEFVLNGRAHLGAPRPHVSRLCGTICFVQTSPSTRGLSFVFVLRFFILLNHYARWNMGDAYR